MACYLNLQLRVNRSAYKLLVMLTGQQTLMTGAQSQARVSILDLTWSPGGLESRHWLPDPVPKRSIGAWQQLQYYIPEPSIWNQTYSLFGKGSLPSHYQYAIFLGKIKWLIYSQNH